LSGRWDRFSWFGFHPVTEDGELQITKGSIELTLAEVGNLLEAILIECIEPRQNRKQGNQFYGIEYLQKEDEIIAKKKLEQNLRDLLSK
jgi:hypothetical protein